MTVAEELRQLDALYHLYEDITGGVEIACVKGCADCCTRNVVVTTLEGYRLAAHLAQGQGDVFESLRTEVSNPRFIPKITTNRLAQLCMEGREPPEEIMAPPDSRCTILSGAVCAAYRFRPFACRCMVSKIRCADTGIAEMDDFAVTVNTVFLQFIEHLDVGGCSGNLIDILMVLESEAHRRRYRQRGAVCRNPLLIPNIPIPVLMVPQEHRRRLSPWIRSIQKNLAF